MKKITKPQQITEPLLVNVPNVPTLKNNPQAIEARREQVFVKHVVEGKSILAVAKELRVSHMTIKRDLFETKKQQLKEVEELRKSFDIKGFVASQLQDIKERRQLLWKYARAGDKNSVQAIKELRELAVEQEDLLRRLGIKTSEAGKDELLSTRSNISIFTGAPPPGFKELDEY